MSRICRVDGWAVASVGPDFAYTAAEPPPHNTTTIVRLVDDDGVAGYAGYDADSFGDFETESLASLRRVAPSLLGRRIWSRAGVSRLAAGAEQKPPGPLSAFDIAMWDIAAIRAGLPLWQMLGGAQESLPAYASLAYQADAADYLATVAQARRDGFEAVKLHVSGEPEADLALCAAVREAHPELAILVDAEGVYDAAGARLVAESLGALRCRWLEAPLPDDDLAGYRELRRHSTVPVLPAGEGIWDLRDFGHALAAGSPWDAIRTDVTYAGGISFATRLGGIARAFGLEVELVSYGHGLVQAANLHAMLGLGGASYFELAYPSEPWSFGVANPLALGVDGRVRANDLPGLGVRLEHDVIESATIAEFHYEDT